jgi:hypothetical protein
VLQFVLKRVESIDPQLATTGRVALRCGVSIAHSATESDARGGDDAGPNLLRSTTMLDDQKGELILPACLGQR